MLSIQILAALLATSAQEKRDILSDVSFSNRICSALIQLPDCLSRYLNYPPGPGVLGFPRCLFENPFPQNKDFWLKGIDFSCVSPWNDTYGSQRCGTAISKRHVLFAKHFPLSVGTRIAFVGNRGDVSHYTIKAIKGLEDCDIMIGLLDYELTPDVHPAKVLPCNYDKWLKDRSRWPVVTFDQQERAYLTELLCARNDTTGEMMLNNRRSTDPLCKKFGGNLISGDSGNPAFLIYRNSPVLLYCIHFGGFGHGPMIHHHRAKIEHLMNDLSPGYKLDTFQFLE